MDKYISLNDLLDLENTLQFIAFNNDTAWQLGNLLKQLAEYKKATVAIEVYAFNQILFSFAMTGTHPDNSVWIKRKRQSV